MATITGDGGNNVLPGTAENDTINGLSGSDTLRGLVGNDTLNGGQQNDTLSGGLGSNPGWPDRHGYRGLQRRHERRERQLTDRPRQ